MTTATGGGTVVAVRALVAAVVMSAVVIVAGPGGAPAEAARASAPASAVAPARQGAATPDCLVTAPITPGTTGSQVGCLQYLLALIGFYRGELTGSYDDATMTAVRAYQAFHPPLATSGDADVDTLTSLGMYERPDGAAVVADACTADADLPRGASSPGVGCIQRHLAAAQLFTAPVDGVLGDTTVAALAAFQAKNPALAQDGSPDPRTLAALGVWSGHRVGDAPGGSTGVAGGDTGTPTVRPVVAGPWPAPARSDYPLWNRPGHPLLRARHAVHT